MYGFEAASEYYFSKHAKDLTLPEAALLAGLPKGPVGYSPLLNPERAFRRRNTVINAMLEDGAITAAQANAAKAEPLGLHVQAPPNSVAPWFVEEVRKELEKKLGTDQVHEDGLRVYTTLDLDLQRDANMAVLDGLAEYERRHGWKGHLLNAIAGGISLDDFKHPDWVMPIEGWRLHTCTRDQRAALRGDGADRSAGSVAVARGLGLDRRENRGHAAASRRHHLRAL